MPEAMKRRSGKAGLPPGALVHVGERRRDISRITVFDYDEDHFEEKTVKPGDKSLKPDTGNTVKWIDVDGIHEVKIIEEIGQNFGLHSLVLEDILTTDQRPKIENYGNYIYMVARMIYCNEKQSNIVTEQMSIVLGSNFVITFQEKSGDVFDPIRDRIRKNAGRIRKVGADYLAYSLLDAIVDNYFITLEKIGDKIEYAEDGLVFKPQPKVLNTIYSLKREVLFIHKSVWPLREVINTLQRGESDLINDSTTIYIRDVYDHIVQIMDTTETFRDMLSGMLDVYLSSLSNRMNEVMKVLTIISTLFMPLTFIAGLYGMNFKYMPELGWRLGYPAVILVMALCVLLMLNYFRRKKWL